MNSSKNFSHISHRYIQPILTFIFSGLIIFNIFLLFLKTFDQYSKLEQISLKPGFEFEGLKNYLKGIPRVGYISDKNQSAEGNDGRFMMAQYMLAPTVLDLNNPNHRYVVLDVLTPESAINILKIINARVITVTPYGKILAERQ